MSNNSRSQSLPNPTFQHLGILSYVCICFSLLLNIFKLLVTLKVSFSPNEQLRGDKRDRPRETKTASSCAHAPTLDVCEVSNLVVTTSKVVLLPNKSKGFPNEIAALNGTFLPSSERYFTK